MTFWLIAGGISALAVALLLPPILRRPGALAARDAFDRTVYRDQLAELERDQARGVLSAGEAAAARTEVERRLLATAGPEARRGKKRAKGGGRPADRGRPWLVAGVLAAALPAAALGLYGWLGRPGIPSISFAEQQQGVEQNTGEMASVIERLAERMAKTPDDPAGWTLLARSYLSLERYEAAARAFRQAVDNGDDSALAWANLGEALTAAAGGKVVPAARQAFAEALKREPRDSRGRYYGGLALAQDGRLAEALETWQALAGETPPDAPWRQLLDQQIASVDSSLGQEAPTAQSAPGPSAADVATATEMSGEDREAFIRSMVGRLAARLESEPGDLDGWLRLTRAYGVLGEREKAVAAVARAAELVAELPAEAPERQAVERARAALPRAE